MDSTCDADVSSSTLESKVPDDITLDSVILDVAFHPNRDIIATSTISGEIFLHSYTNDGTNNEIMDFTHHKKSCRKIQFNKEGTLLFSVSKDKSMQIVDLNTGAIAHKMLGAHKSPIYSLLVIDEYLTATGDDEGVFKIWDYRRATAIMEAKNSEEYISSMTINNAKKILLATSGEGTLTAFNVRAKRMELQSELFETEFLSVAIVKKENKVVVGGEDGSLNIFNWGEWGNISDRFPGHPMTVDCIQPLTESVVITGSLDGTIRAVNILPNRFIGVIGEHDDSSIEALTLNPDKTLLASCGHDEAVKFWDVRYLHEVVVSDKSKARRNSKNKHVDASRNTSSEFFADLADEPEVEAELETVENSEEDSD